MDDKRKPRRAYVLDLKIQANTKADLLGALQMFRTDLARGELSGHGVSGSPSFGWIYDLDIDESITKEAYFAALDEVLGEAPR